MHGHHRNCGAKRSKEYKRVQRQHRAEACSTEDSWVLCQAVHVTTHAGNKADTETWAAL